MSLEAFAKALAEFQADLPTVGKDQTAKVKTKQGGEYSYQYTDLATIAAKALPLLAKHGLSFSARPTLTGESGFVLAYSLLHVEGHREAGFYPLPDPAQHSPQEIGSAITYARRYTLCCATGIAPGEDDDDGQNAALARSAKPQPKPDPLAQAKSRVWAAAQRLTMDRETLEVDYAKSNDGQLLANATVEQLNTYAKQLEDDMAVASA